MWKNVKLFGKQENNTNREEKNKRKSRNNNYKV